MDHLLHKLGQLGLKPGHQLNANQTTFGCLLFKEKKFILNLNNYRNAHYRVLSTAKKIYSEDLVEKIQDLPKFIEPVRLTYTYYARSNRKT